MSKSTKIGIIILAGGSSSRMGKPKQLLKIDGQTLIERVISITKGVKNTQIVVVLGANAKQIEGAIKKEKAVDIIINEDWQKGMGTTLRAGVEFLLEKSPNLEAIIVTVCDQPYLSATIFQDLIETYHTTQTDIVAAEYGFIKGVPALFSKKVFPKLVELKEDEGARKIIKNYRGQIATIAFPKGIIDLDTPEAYQQFLEIYSKEK